MLRLRVLTAVVLLAVLLAAFALGPMAVAAVLALVFGGAAYEWLRLSGTAGPAAAAIGLALAAALATLEWRGLRVDGAALGVLLAAAACAWLLIVAWVLSAAHGDAGDPGSAAKIALGVVVLAAAWWSVLALYRLGALYLFSALAIVWIADIAAYFAGRAFGRRKLAPRISPGKTWAGVGGAIVGVVAAALLAWLAWPHGDLFTNALIGRSHVTAAVTLVFLVALSIAGDLFESLLKRQAGVKDSSALLPGHGGVLDRIDALLPVLPAAVLIERWLR